MKSPEWLIEHGIGETRAALVERGRIVEARIELEGAVPAGSVLTARLVNNGVNGCNAIAVAEGGTEYLLPRGAPGVTQGATLSIEVTRGRIPGVEPWKLPLARITAKPPTHVAALAARLGGRTLVFPAAKDELGEAGWDELMDEATSTVVRFAGGELRISPTPAMTLIDVDGYLAADELAALGAAEAGRTIRRLDIGGSIGIDLPTTRSKSARDRAAQELDAVLTKPFERTAVNGFGFVQIVRPRTRASIVEIAEDRASFAARAALRRATLEGPGSKRLVANHAVIQVLESRPEWLNTLARQVGGSIALRAEASLPILGAYVESV